MIQRHQNHIRAKSLLDKAGIINTPPHWVHKKVDGSRQEYHYQNFECLSFSGHIVCNACHYADICEC